LRRSFVFAACLIAFGTGCSSAGGIAPSLPGAAAQAALSGEAAAAHFGWLGMFVGLDFSASSAQTRAALGWEPTGPSLLSDLAAMRYPDA